jgi:hypothetical protein
VLRVATQVRIAATVTDTERLKALYVLGHWYTVYDLDGFLTHRDQWRVVRELAGVTGKELGETRYLVHQVFGVVRLRVQLSYIFPRAFVQLFKARIILRS